MLKKWVVLTFASAFTLAACHSPVYNQTMSNVAEVKIKTAQATKRSDDSAKPIPPLTVKEGHYVDTTPISLARDPSWLNNKIIIRGDALPFSYYSRVIASGAKRELLTKYQVGLDPAVKISMNYSGSIRGALNAIAAQTGYVYTINENSVYWQAFVTRTLDIAFMPGVTDYLMGKKGGSNGSTASQSSGGQVQNFVSSDSSDAEYSNLSAKLSVWADLEATLKQMISADGKVTVSQASTTVTVRDRPTNVKLVEQYVQNLNQNLSRQVLVKIQVLEVTLENDYEFGINWALIGKAFNRNSRYVLNGSYGTPVSITSFVAQGPDLVTGNPAAANAIPTLGTEWTGNGSTGYTALINALNQQGHTSIVSEPRVVSLNNQVSVISIVTQNGYVASVQNTAGVGGGTSNSTLNTVTSQVTPGNLITGLNLYVLPKILNDKVYMQVNADLSTNLGFQLGGTGSSQISLPNISEKHFNQRSLIKSGDTLILSGFRQVTNVANASQLLTSQALGGKGSQQVTKETIVLITPIILT